MKISILDPDFKLGQKVYAKFDFNDPCWGPIKAEGSFIIEEIHLSYTNKRVHMPNMSEHRSYYYEYILSQTVNKFLSSKYNEYKRPINENKIWAILNCKKCKKEFSYGVDYCEDDKCKLYRFVILKNENL